MSDDLTNSQIALLCDIGEFDHKLTGDQKRDLERLISGDYVKLTESHPVGLNAHNQGPRFS